MNSEPLYISTGKSFNVREFGAHGTASDDTAAFQECLDAACGYSASNGSPCVVVPAGHYRINQHLGSQICGVGRLVVGGLGIGRIHIRGEGGPVLTSSADAYPDNQLDILLAIWGGINCLVEGLTFLRTPDSNGNPRATSSSTNTAAVGDAATLTTFRNCVFIDFPQAAYLQGSEGTRFENCRWIYTDGLACGRGPGLNSPNGWPAVGILPLGCRDITVTGCDWRGTERMDANASVPMDGFIRGDSRGWIVRDNWVRRVGVEGIYLRADGAPNPARAAIVSGNHVDCEMPQSVPGSLLRAMVRMGIRVDDHNAIIQGNFVSASRSPISINQLNDYAAIQRRSGGIISGNVITFDASDCAPLGGSVLYGICLQERDNVKIYGNQILFPSGVTGDVSKGLPTAGVTLAGCNGIEVESNTVQSDGGATGDVWGLYLSGANNGSQGGNRFTNLTKDIGKYPGSSGTIAATAPNTLVQTPQAT